MDANKIDKLFKDALYDMEQPVDANLWAGIERSMRARKIKRIAFYSSAVAAVLVLALILAINPFSTNSNNIESVAIAQNVADEQQQVQIVQEISDPAKVNNATAEVAKPSKPIARKDVGKVVEKEVKAVEEAKEVEVVKSVEAAKPQSSYIAQANFIDEGEPSVKRKKHSFAISSNIASGRGNVNANGNYRSPLGLNGNGAAVQLEQVSEVKYSLPLNVGLQVQFPIRGFISVGLGLNYSMLVSKFDALLDKQMVNVKQTLHYMGIPANVYFRFIEKSNFNFYGNAGVALEWGVGSKYNVKSYDYTKSYSEKVKGILFSVNAGIGVEYIFGHLFGLYIEPNVVYYPNSKVKRSIRTDQPLQIRAEIGCRFHF